jgi:hypothetical protein
MQNQLLSKTLNLIFGSKNFEPPPPPYQLVKNISDEQLVIRRLKLLEIIQLLIATELELKGGELK